MGQAHRDAARPGQLKLKMPLNHYQIAKEQWPHDSAVRCAADLYRKNGQKLTPSQSPPLALRIRWLELSLWLMLALPASRDYTGVC
jgi:hypothetical protein